MKKVISMSLAILMATTVFTAAIFAEKGGNGKGNKEVIEEVAVEENVEATEEVEVVEVEDAEDVSEGTADEVTEDEKNKAKEKRLEAKEKLELLKAEMKETRKNWQEQKEIIKEMAKVRREEGIKDKLVFVDGEEVEADVPPVIKEGRMLLPLRAITNALGAEVDWNQDTKLATITKAVYGEDTVTGEVYLADTTVITFDFIDPENPVVKVDGETVELDTKPGIYSNRTMVPVRFIAETFNQLVEWDEETQTAIIGDEDEEAADEEDSTESENDDSTESNGKGKGKLK